ncbi:hypothetical protein [Longirhabdus pacifica]|uniref:hypothetical protein n=1 Tax=Longirhabdus pacifica TaxID=2305227 RepID=UPI001009211A|nr:hypothetical protein [Longirhabdus pacifica]
MIKVGDVVTYRLDGTIGTVVDVKRDKIQIVWEDGFTSWETRQSILKNEDEFIYYQFKINELLND